MKSLLKMSRSRSGMTLVEVMLSLGCGAVVLAVVLIAGVALQRSFMAVEGYSMAQGDQLRVLDYLALDCRRSVSAYVEPVTNRLTLLVPTYYKDDGSVWTPVVMNGAIQYGGRTRQDGVTTLGSPIVTSATAGFTSSDVGKLITSSNLPFNTTIASVTSATVAVVSANATATSLPASPVVIQIGSAVAISYYQSGASFIRNVKGVESPIATNVASFTVTPIDLTSSLSCKITFAPRFTNSHLANDSAPVVGTTVYCNTFLRNASARQ
jgi:hypothetical protein